MADDWQPISTAPKDQDVLVFCPDARGPQIIIAALVTFVDVDDETITLEDWTDVWMETELEVEPTFWQPLPALPAEALSS